MTNLEKAIQLIKKGGYKKITEVPVDLYYQVVQEMPAGARVSVNNGTENLIVYHGMHAIAPSESQNG